jgi:5-formyltetrahydrofolate cyclo-ligase
MEWPEVRAWRKTARSALIAARVATPATMRGEWTAALVAALRPILADAPQPISFYWPLKGEPDFRPFMRELDEDGVQIALPVAIKLGEAMTFRPWHRGVAMERGIWNIPIPATTEEVLPRTLIAPIVGFDAENYRLGYGGGFFDRTLEKLAGTSQAIGVGFSMFALPTIHPQPHDIPMARIITEVAQDDLNSRARSGSAPGETPGMDAALTAKLLTCLTPLATSVQLELRPLVDFILWQLKSRAQSTTTSPLTGPEALDVLRVTLPTVPRSAQYVALRALIDSIDAAPAT